MKGRPPVPTALKLLRGNPGKRRLNPNEPKPGPLTTDCPPELTDADAKEEWERTIIPAIHRRQVTSADRVFAIAHCELWATWRSQLADASRHPHIVAAGNGKPIPNPARGMANRTLLLLARIDSELGLTPASRTRVQVAKEEIEGKPDKWAGILP